MELNLEIIKARKLLEENGYEVRKNDNACPTCGVIGYHFCTGKKMGIDFGNKTYNISIGSKKDV